MPVLTHARLIVTGTALIVGTAVALPVAQSSVKVEYKSQDLRNGDSLAFRADPAVGSSSIRIRILKLVRLDRALIADKWFERLFSVYSDVAAWIDLTIPSPKFPECKLIGSTSSYRCDFTKVSTNNLPSGVYQFHVIGPNESQIALTDARITVVDGQDNLKDLLDPHFPKLVRNSLARIAFDASPPQSIVGFASSPDGRVVTASELLPDRETFDVAFGVDPLKTYPYRLVDRTKDLAWLDPVDSYQAPPGARVGNFQHWLRIAEDVPRGVISSMKRASWPSQPNDQVLKDIARPSFAESRGFKFACPAQPTAKKPGRSLVRGAVLLDASLTVWAIQLDSKPDEHGECSAVQLKLSNMDQATDARTLAQFADSFKGWITARQERNP